MKIFKKLINRFARPVLTVALFVYVACVAFSVSSALIYGRLDALFTVVVLYFAIGIVFMLVVEKASAKWLRYSVSASSYLLVPFWPYILYLAFWKADDFR